MPTATNFCFAFDFDEWASLAKANPHAFEARRQALIDDYLRQFPDAERRRLRGLQFRIDMERRRARTPMAACIRLSSMMWDSLLGQDGLIDAIDRFLRYRPDRPAHPQVRAGSPRSATILAFRKPAR